MRLKDILKEMKAIQTMPEMALKNTGLIGDFENDGSFEGPDRKVHVKLKRDGFSTIDLPIGDSFPVIQNLDVAAVDKAMSHIEKYLNILFKEALEEAKGKYYVL